MVKEVGPVPLSVAEMSLLKIYQEKLNAASKEYDRYLTMTSEEENRAPRSFTDVRAAYIAAFGQIVTYGERLKSVGRLGDSNDY